MNENSILFGLVRNPLFPASQLRNARVEAYTDATSGAIVLCSVFVGILRVKLAWLFSGQYDDLFPFYDEE